MRNKNIQGGGPYAIKLQNNQAEKLKITRG
jgi:hypothetical protein